MRKKVIADLQAHDFLSHNYDEMSELQHTMSYL